MSFSKRVEPNSGGSCGGSNGKAGVDYTGDVRTPYERTLTGAVYMEAL